MISEKTHAKRGEDGHLILFEELQLEFHALDRVQSTFLEGKPGGDSRAGAWPAKHLGKIAMSAQREPMSDRVSPNHTPPGAGLITETLLARPHLRERAGELAFKRLEVEAYYRPHRTDRDETAPVTWLRGRMMDILRLGLKCTGLFQRGLRNALNLRLVEHDFVYQDLPEELAGFRILQLSDLHLPGRFPRFAETAAALLQGIEVDLCVLNGDYRWGYYGPADHVSGQLRHILSGVRSRFGTVACLGNHDILAVAELLESSGIPILFNEGAPLHVGNAVLWVCAIDDPHVFRCDRLELALRDAPPGAFILLLVHTPERIAEAEKAGVSLYLCGHTHGGQIRVPVLGALSKNAKCTREQSMGKWRSGSMLGYTTTGLGTTDVPVRFLCPPEATVITLRRG